MVACFTSDVALGGPFLAKSRYHIARGHRMFARLGPSSYGSKNRSLTSTTTRPSGRSAPSQRWRGCGRYVRTAWCCDGLTSATPSVDFSTPRSLCCSGGGGLQTTRPNFRVAVLLKYRSNAHDAVEGTYADDPGPIGSLRKLLGGRSGSLPAHRPGAWVP